jgi:hypothetical protein
VDDSFFGPRHRIAGVHVLAITTVRRTAAEDRPEPRPKTIERTRHR